MNEQEWFTWDDPPGMLRYLTEGGKPCYGCGGRGGPCGCCGSVPLGRLPWVTDRKLRLFAWECYISSYSYPRPELGSAGPDETRCTPPHTGCPPAADANYWASEAAVPERPKRAAFLRDIFGNPFRRVSRMCECGGGGPETGLLIAFGFYLHDSCAPLLAPVIRWAALDAYESGDFSSLPVIADMIEDTGLVRPEWPSDAPHLLLLEHLRSPSRHVRGCWAVDLLLGKA